MDLDILAENVVTKEDFAHFVHMLLKSFEEDPKSWGENDTLLMYLQGLFGASLTIERFYENTDREFPRHPTWQMFAEMLLTAQVYE